jgi:hypothetical protein
VVNAGYGLVADMEGAGINCFRNCGLKFQVDRVGGQILSSSWRIIEKRAGWLQNCSNHAFSYKARFQKRTITLF